MRVKLVIIFFYSLALAIPSGFGRSRIHRNFGYTLLAVVLILFNSVIVYKFR
ncbi:hypothetical protein T190611E02C_50111 [Tenacibaculum sp. 190524A05c]